MDKEITFKHLIAGIVISLLPAMYSIWSSTKQDLRNTVQDHGVTLNSHEMRLNAQEKQNDYQLKLLNEINKGIVEIKLELKDKQDRE